MSRATSVFGGLLLGGALFALCSTLVADFDPQNAALGPFTVSRDAVFEGEDVVFIGGGDLDRVAARVETARHEGVPVALWLGASHQYAVNGYQPGQENAVWHANRLARARRSDLLYLGVGLPNGNANEFLAVYLALRDSGALPERLIVGAVYDDLREPGVRPAVRQALPALDAPLLSRLGAAGQQLLAAQRDAPPPVERNAVDGTPQQAMETAVVSWLERSVPPFRHRHQLSGWITWQTRARLFDIGEVLRRLGNPQRRSVPVPPALQRWNETALDALLDLAADDGVAIVVYKVPHPSTDGPFYHVRARYDDFHARLRARCDTLGATYLDLESLIALPHFMFETALDPWHFDETGHRLLADAIDAAMAR